ncbi:MAG: hypothetical protein IH944_06045 [Armatimonadetes bacterium]|nr:hypothetical protein [Armatimonadota bacterium]
MCSALSSCGADPASAPTVGSDGAELVAEDKRVFEGGPVEIFLDYWELQAEDSSATVADSGSAVINLTQVSGDLLDQDGGGIASRFVADFGVADRSTGHLELTGRVTLTSVGENVFLKADRVVFNEQAGYVTAEGNVRIESASIRLGPFNTLLATPGLERVGTPEIFES